MVGRFIVIIRPYILNSHAPYVPRLETPIYLAVKLLNIHKTKVSSGQVRRDSYIYLTISVDLNLISPVRSHSTDYLTSEYPLMSLQCTFVFVLLETSGHLRL